MWVWSLALVAQVTFAGTVQSADGSPVPGATVVVRQEVGARTVVTDRLGRFEVADVDLPATIDVRAPGFAPVSRVVLTTGVVVTLAPASVSESVVVSADRAGIWRDAERGSTVLTRDDLDRVPALTLDEGIRIVSGFSLFRRSSARQANPTTHGVTMRGLAASGASRGLVLLDGVPLNEGFGGWVTWTRVPALAVGRVELDRGPAGDAFGSDALGGVIQIVPPAVSLGDWRVSAAAGSQATGQLDASAAGEAGRWAWFGAGSLLRSDGSIPVESSARGAVDQATDLSIANAYGRAVMNAGTRRLTIAGWGGRDDRGNGTVAQRNRMAGGTAAVTFDASGARSTFAARLSVSPNDFEQSFSAVSDDRSREFVVLRQNTETMATRVVVEAGHTLPSGHLIVRGTVADVSATLEETRSSGTTVSDLDDRSGSLSAQAGFTPAARLSLSTGLRTEWRSAPELGDPESATVGHIGATWRASDRVGLRGSVAGSHRWPTLNELARSFRVGDILTLNNPDLEAERALSVDGAVSVEGPRWQASVGGFWTRVSDAIFNVTLSDDDGILRERQNAGQTRARGLELDAELRPVAGMRVRSSVTIVTARLFDAVDPDLDGNRLPQVPRTSFTLAADLPLPRDMTASVTWRASSSQFDDDRNVFRLSSARQLDLRLAGAAGRHVGWHLLLENAFDADIEVGRTPLVTLAPPRAVRVGVTIR